MIHYSYNRLQVKSHTLIGMVLLFGVMLMSACKKDESAGDIEPEKTGVISGKVVAPNQRTPISRALVFISTANQFYSTYTDINGQFNLTAAIGNHELQVQTGHGDIFRTIVPVSITENQTTALSAPIQLNLVANLAFISGSYDKIETILMDSLGYSAASLNYTHLQHISGLAPYDAVFINCGAFNAFVNFNTDTALSQYVTGGGSIYASDFSMNFITGQHAFIACDQNRFYGFMPDSTVCSRRTGTISVVPEAQVVSPELQQFLGKNTMLINYNLGTWERIQSINNNVWETLVTDPTDQSPLLIRTNRFNGSQPPAAVGSTDTSRVTICHRVPNGNPVTITISNSALAAHLAHGDVIGACNNPQQRGWVYFTTFHNEHNGMISNDVRKILQFMILNL